MNGYLNNLALRTMNAGNLVEPRLPSLFEPQRVVESAVELSTDAPARVPRDVPVSVPTRIPGSAPSHSNSHPESTHATVAENSTAANEVVNTDNTIRTPYEEPPTKISVEHMLANIPDAAEAPETETFQETFDEKAPEKMINEVPVVRVETVSKQSLSPALKSAKLPRSKEPASDSVQSAESVERDSAPIVTFTPQFQSEDEEQQQATSEIEERIPIKTEVAPHFVKPVVESSRNIERTDFKSITRSVTNRSWRKSVAADPETSINVTIGRVEVRAMPATNPKPGTSRAESPVMPLEEYLRKQRLGGER
jgi:hypothetical protein